MNDEIRTENGETEDFKKLFEQSLKIRDDFSIGDRIKGTIVYITDDVVFLNISGKSEAIIDTIELKDKNGNLNYKKGDEISVFIVSLKNGEIKTSLRIGSGEINPELLYTAYRNNMPVEGTVFSEVKGGYTINVSGYRCFCPYSQIDFKLSDDKLKYINKSFIFRIIEYKENGKNIILSRKVLLEEEKKEKEEKLKTELKCGDVVSGVVASRHDFGIFIDLGGVEGLIPKSEISWSRNADISVLNPGDEVKAKILSIDWEANRITLSIKQTLPEPWSGIKRYHENQVVSGRVVNIISQGAFIEIEPGLEGFIHISRMSPVKKIKKPEEVLKKNDLISATILSIDEKNKKISLQLLTGEADPWQQPVDTIMNESHKGIVESVNNSGVSLRLENGMLGFIPKNELVSQNEMQKQYTAGKELIVTVKDLQIENKKLILSEKGARIKEELNDYNSFKTNNQISSSSLGNMFKDKFDVLIKQVKEK
jgi:small subunit ribosomal protein S1